jgi:subtilisin family serine protease
MVMAASIMTQPVFGANSVDSEQTHGIIVQEQSGVIDFEAALEFPTVTQRGERVAISDESLDFLNSTTTLRPESRVQGFVLDYALPDDPAEMVDIIVQFQTPPSVALRLLEEAANPRARVSDVQFEEQALAAHSRFMEQLNGSPVPFGLNTATTSVTGSSHTLLNAVYMTVAAGMVEQIANLPEVFMVTPQYTWYTLAQLDAMNNNPTITGGRGERVENNSSVADSTDYIVEIEAADYGDYTPHPEYNAGALELFEMDYIHNTIGVTGKGVKLGIIDTGVDYRHPLFAKYLVPTNGGHVNIGGVPHGLRGANFLLDAGRPSGLNTSPMENIAGAGNAHSSHGTHVAGTAVAMAPDVELWAYRVIEGTAHPGFANSVIRAIEDSYKNNLDVINLSLGHYVNTPWDSTAYAVNLATLGGVTVVGAAGNDGVGGGNTHPVGGWFSMGGGVSTGILSISVGSGTGGNRKEQVSTGSVNGTPAQINLTGWTGQNRDSVAGIFNQEFDYFWFGLTQMPTGGNTNPAFPAFINEVREKLLDGGDLSGKVAVFNRGNEFVSMADLSVALNAEAHVIINNEISNAHINNVNISGGGRPMPIFSMRRDDGLKLIGDPGAALAAVGVAKTGTGKLNFGDGTVTSVATQDLMTPSSGVGPMGPALAGDWTDPVTGTNSFSIRRDPELVTTMMVRPDIVAPGNSIVSTWPVSRPENIDGRPYNAIGGTSMASPAVAGIVALMIEQFPTADPIEIKARLMNTARDLGGYDGTYSVLQAGAGFVVPRKALESTAYATANHRVPLGGPSWGGSNVVTGTRNLWTNQDMASISFGNVEIPEDIGDTTDKIRVTIEGGSNWSADSSLIIPTQSLAQPAGGNPAQWGPALTFTNTGVTVNIDKVSDNEFDVSFTHDGNVNNRGFAQGYITFTSASQVLRMPFGGFFNVELPPEPLQAHPSSMIWRPVISSFVNTPDNFGAEDIRAHGVNVAADLWEDPNEAVVTQSNYSTMSFGYNNPDPLDRTARATKFYLGKQGSALGEKELIYTDVPRTAGALVHHLTVVRTVVGGTVWNLDGPTGDVFLIEDGLILTPGIWEITAVVEHGAGEAYDLVQTFEFSVSDERPTLEIQGAETVDGKLRVIVPNNATVSINGQIRSDAHEWARTQGLRISAAWPFNPVPMTGAHYAMQIGAQAFNANAAGLSMVTAGTLPTTGTGTVTYTMTSIDACGVYIDYSNGWIRTAAANRSNPVTVDFVSQALVDVLSGIEDTLTKAKAETPEGITAESYARLQAAIDALNVTVDSPTRTVNRLQQALAALQAALDSLTPDRNARGPLAAAIAHASGLESSNYTRMSWARLESVLNQAKALGANATEFEVETMTQALWGAINNLIIVGINWVNINQAIAAAQAIEQAEVLESDWIILQDAIAVALEVSNNANALQSTVDAAANALANVISNLTFVEITPDEPIVDEPEEEEEIFVPTLDFVALDAAISRASAQVQISFTRFAWRRMQDALANAVTVRADVSADQATIDSIVEELEFALNNPSDGGL